jgi:nuclease S1
VGRLAGHVSHTRSCPHCHHRGASDEDRLKALKWVVRQVADDHLPLHADFADHRGGNSFQVQAFTRGSNLRSVWDSGLVRK